ncbi:MAG: ABC transporter ATP-binding protein [Firmicutes bacterium]|nr:ABC transporter ATP-binding protein [Bacillota bacterium]
MENNEIFEEEVFEAKHKKATLKRFIKSMGRQKFRLTIVILSVILYTGFTIYAPMYSAGVIDLIYGKIKAATGGTPFTVTWTDGGQQILILFLLYFASWLFYTLQAFLMSSFAERMNLQFRKEIEAKINRLPLSYFDGHQPGEIMSRAVNDLDKMSEALQSGLLKLFTAVGTIIGSLAIMFYYNVWLTLIFLLFIALSMLLTKLVSKKMLNSAIKRQQSVSEVNRIVEEAYSGRIVIRAFNLEAKSSAELHNAAEELAQDTQKADFIMTAVNPATRLINRIGQVIIAIFGGYMLLGGSFSPGKFQAFFQYINQASEPITELSYMINTLQSALASAERIYEFLDEEEIVPDPADAARPFTARGDVEFKDVRFGYSADKLLMDGISFSAKAGQKIAIVGNTGAGKTTVINLLMRFYEIAAGGIYLDGISTKTMNYADLRSNFGMVLQDTWLFEGTIAENIAYGKANATREEIVAAATAARADFFIRTLPNGYDTVLSSDAENISVGQRQLLTIARVFLCNPPVLILDEATSSVDTRTETEIVKAMRALMRGRTSFVIAHRLSTIVDADLILVMKNGSIVEQGNHKQLLADKGVYADLYNSQFA